MPRTPPCTVRPLRRAPYHWALWVGNPPETPKNLKKSPGAPGPPESQENVLKRSRESGKSLEKLGTGIGGSNLRKLEGG